MKAKEWLEKVAHLGPSNIPDDVDGDIIYYSNLDNSYITRVGMEDSVGFLAEREITEDLTHGVGFSPKDGKWYGWSHRAIYGFEIGSTCEKGDCHYKPANLKDQLEDAVRFWDDEDRLNVTAKVSETERDQIEVSWEYPDSTPNKKLRGTVGGTTIYFDPDNYGRGEWVAKTMEDAKQMAIDFNAGVS